MGDRRNPKRQIRRHHRERLKKKYIRMCYNDYILFLYTANSKNLNVYFCKTISYRVMLTNNVFAMAPIHDEIDYMMYVEVNANKAVNGNPDGIQTYPYLNPRRYHVDTTKGKTVNEYNNENLFKEQIEDFEIQMPNSNWKRYKSRGPDFFG